MATKTLILRPYGTNESTLSNVTFYPSGIRDRQGHLLVYESIADDDATYILLGKNSNIDYNFVYVKPEDFGKLIKFELNYRIKAEVVGSSSTQDNGIGHTIFANDVSFPFLATYLGNKEGYVDIATITTGPLEKHISFNDDFYFYIRQIVGDSNKNNPIRVTQLYVTITYETKEPVYIKENDSWTEVNGSIYQKNNDVWELTDANVFTNEQKFLVKQLQ